MDNIHFSRLSPLTILLRILQRIPGLIIPLYFIFKQNDKVEFYVLIISSLLGLIFFSFYLFDFIFYKYLITEKEVIIKQGVIAKKERVIPIEKIQNISMEQTFLMKLLGLCVLKIETAGDTSLEGELNCVSLKKGNELSDYLKNLKNNFEQTVTLVDETIANELEEDKVTANKFIEEESVIFELPTNQLLLFGLINLRLTLLPIIFWIFGIISTYANSYLKEIIQRIEDTFEGVGNQISSIEIALYLIASIILFVVTSIVIDIIFTFNTYYNFKLTKSKNKLYTSRGLLNTIKGAIPINKLQMIVLKTNILKEKLNYFGLRLETAGGGRFNGAEIAIPFAKLELIIDTLRHILPVEFPNEYRNISKKSIARNIFKQFLGFTILIFGINYFSETNIFKHLALDFTIAFIYISIIPLSYLSWKNKGYQITERLIFIKVGVIYKSVKVIPINKIQTLSVSQSLWTKFLGLAKLTIDTAATSNQFDAGLRDLDIESANEIFEILTKSFYKLRKEAKHIEKI